MSRERMTFDGVLVLGGGLAGLSAALAAAPRRALVVTARPLTVDAASAWAQGGIAAALGDGDTPAQHMADTVAAGAGLVNVAAARVLAEEAAGAVRWLADLGAPFDRDEQGGFVLGLEAAHGRARVARVHGDGAGAAIMAAVARAALAAGHIEVLDGAEAASLLQDADGRVRGVLVRRGETLVEIVAPATVLATGGVGGLYAITTNPAAARGQGLAMAAAARAELADIEFVQFHPTAIDVGRDPAPLATEALRGEGATLVDAAGCAFMAAEHAAGDLAPRDVVARAVQRRVSAGEGAFLDARALGEALPHHFPAVFGACMAAGIDPRVTPIPVAPAAHYHMGGVATDLDGRTSVPGLWAAGEVACTGVHGANRLASNSLAEAVVFGRRAGAEAARAVDPATAPLPSQRLKHLHAEDLTALRLAMSRDAGVVRDAVGLRRLHGVISELQGRIGSASELIVARGIAEAALARRESVGAHHRDDAASDLAEAA